MDRNRLYSRCIAVARAFPPSSEVPYGFETRVMARLRALSTDDLWTLWGRALWRSAFACLALALGLTMWSLQSDSLTAQDLDAAMVAAADSAMESW